MIAEKKYCEKCWKLISDINTADYFSHIRIKYCPECAKAIHNEQKALRMKSVRRMTRENHKLTKQLNNRLMQENELLKRQLEAKREEIERLGRI